MRKCLFEYCSCTVAQASDHPSQSKMDDMRGPSAICISPEATAIDLEANFAASVLELDCNMLELADLSKKMEPWRSCWLMYFELKKKYNFKVIKSRILDYYSHIGDNCFCDLCSASITLTCILRAQGICIKQMALTVLDQIKTLIILAMRFSLEGFDSLDWNSLKGLPAALPMLLLYDERVTVNELHEMLQLLAWSIVQALDFTLFDEDSPHGHINYLSSLMFVYSQFLKIVDKSGILMIHFGSYLNQYGLSWKAFMLKSFESYIASGEKIQNCLSIAARKLKRALQDKEIPPNMTEQDCQSTLQQYEKFMKDMERTRALWKNVNFGFPLMYKSINECAVSSMIADERKPERSDYKPYEKYLHIYVAECKNKEVVTLKPLSDSPAIEKSLLEKSELVFNLNISNSVAGPKFANQVTVLKRLKNNSEDSRLTFEKDLLEKISRLKLIFCPGRKRRKTLSNHELLSMIKDSCEGGNAKCSEIIPRMRTKGNKWQKFGIPKWVYEDKAARKNRILYRRKAVRYPCKSVQWRSSFNLLRIIQYLQLKRDILEPRMLDYFEYGFSMPKTFLAQIYRILSSRFYTLDAFESLNFETHQVFVVFKNIPVDGVGRPTKEINLEEISTVLNQAYKKLDIQPSVVRDSRVADFLMTPRNTIKNPKKEVQKFPHNPEATRNTVLDEINQHFRVNSLYYSKQIATILKRAGINISSFSTRTTMNELISQYVLEENKRREENRLDENFRSQGKDLIKLIERMNTKKYALRETLSTCKDQLKGELHGAGAQSENIFLSLLQEIKRSNNTFQVTPKSEDQGTTTAIQPDKHHPISSKIPSQLNDSDCEESSLSKELESSEGSLADHSEVEDASGNSLPINVTEEQAISKKLSDTQKPNSQKLSNKTCSLNAFEGALLADWSDLTGNASIKKVTSVLGGYFDFPPTAEDHEGGTPESVIKSFVQGNAVNAQQDHIDDIFNVQGVYKTSLQSDHLSLQRYEAQVSAWAEAYSNAVHMDDKAKKHYDEHQHTYHRDYFNSSQFETERALVKIASNGETTIQRLEKEPEQHKECLEGSGSCKKYPSVTHLGNFDITGNTEIADGLERFMCSVTGPCYGKDVHNHIKAHRPHVMFAVEALKVICKPLTIPLGKATLTRTSGGCKDSAETKGLMSCPSGHLMCHEMGQEMLNITPDECPHCHGETWSVTEIERSVRFEATTHSFKSEKSVELKEKLRRTLAHRKEDRANRQTETKRPETPEADGLKAERSGVINELWNMGNVDQIVDLIEGDSSANAKAAKRAMKKAKKKEKRALKKKVQEEHERKLADDEEKKLVEDFGKIKKVFPVEVHNSEDAKPTGRQFDEMKTMKKCDSCEDAEKKSDRRKRNKKRKQQHKGESVVEETKTGTEVNVTTSGANGSQEPTTCSEAPTELNEEKIKASIRAEVAGVDGNAKTTHKKIYKNNGKCERRDSVGVIISNDIESAEKGVCQGDKIPKSKDLRSVKNDTISCTAPNEFDSECIVQQDSQFSKDDSSYVGEPTKDHGAESNDTEVYKNEEQVIENGTEEPSKVKASEPAAKGKKKKKSKKNNTSSKVGGSQESSKTNSQTPSICSNKMARPFEDQIIDVDNLSLPSGVTITKIDPDATTENDRGFVTACTKKSDVVDPVRGVQTAGSEEGAGDFEEVVSTKTKKQRNRAQRRGSESNESPVSNYTSSSTTKTNQHSGSHTQRQQKKESVKSPATEIVNGKQAKVPAGYIARPRVCAQPPPPKKTQCYKQEAHQRKNQEGSVQMKMFPNKENYAGKTVQGTVKHSVKEGTINTRFDRKPSVEKTPYSKAAGNKSNDYCHGLKDLDATKEAVPHKHATRESNDKKCSQVVGRGNKPNAWTSLNAQSNQPMTPHPKLQPGGFSSSPIREWSPWNDSYSLGASVGNVPNIPPGAKSEELLPRSREDTSRDNQNDHQQLFPDMNLMGVGSNNVYVSPQFTPGLGWHCTNGDLTERMKFSRAPGSQLSSKAPGSGRYRNQSSQIVQTPLARRNEWEEDIYAMSGYPFRYHGTRDAQRKESETDPPLSSPQGRLNSTPTVGLWTGDFSNAGSPLDGTLRGVNPIGMAPTVVRDIEITPHFGPPPSNQFGLYGGLGAIGSERTNSIPAMNDPQRRNQMQGGDGGAGGTYNSRFAQRFNFQN